MKGRRNSRGQVVDRDTTKPGFLGLLPSPQVVVMLVIAVGGAFLVASSNCPRSSCPPHPHFPITPSDLSHVESLLTSASGQGASADAYRRLRGLLEVATSAGGGGGGGNSDSPQQKLLLLSHQGLSRCYLDLQRASADVPQSEQCPPCPQNSATVSESASSTAGSRVTVEVSPKNRDVLSMDANAMAQEIEKLRDSIGGYKAAVKRLKREKKALEKDQFKLQMKLEEKPAQEFQGYECEASEKEMAKYNKYSPMKTCPNDWYFVQRLIFKKKCYSLPRRRCRVVTPFHPVEPVPFPQSLFDQSALKDENVRWDLHDCKSYECLVTRSQGDCLDCFNLTKEGYRWKHSFRGTIPMQDVLAMKNGTLRIGLDVGGGTGSFAAHMARYGVTVMTTALNFETARTFAGLPYHETIAARGLIPLHVSHGARLPLYEGVLDVIHSMNSIKYIDLIRFEELMCEWDRVLRVGGLIWFDMFYAQVDLMPKYVEIIDALDYKKLYWNFTPKPEKGERGGEHVYLNCVLEKQPNPGNELLDGPDKADTHW